MTDALERLDAGSYGRCVDCGQADPGRAAGGASRGGAVHRGPGEVRGRALSRTLDIETPVGLARAHVDDAPQPLGLVVLGHGAGGGIEAPDLVAVTAALVAAGWTVARVEQPYRVKGRRAPGPAPRLDAALVAVVVALR